MKDFDSPLEALALNYVSFGFLTVVNNIWTWVAVITAAVSFWRIRASAPITTTSISTISDPQNIRNPDVGPTSTASPPPPSVVAEPPPPPSTSASLASWVGYGATRGTKFTLYYEDEKREEGLTVAGEVGDGGDGVVGVGGEWREWEGMLRMRMGDLGWYNLQDLTVLDGNIVRLWDGGRRKECRLR